MTEHVAPASAPEDRLERLLREFYAAELPAPLRDRAAGEASVRAVPRPAEGLRPLSRTAGLTAAVAALMLALSALLWPGTRPGRPEGAGSHANHARYAGSHGASGPQTGTAHPDAGSRRPVELESGSHSGVPVDADAGRAARENEFPELDIRIIPIEDR